MRKETMGLRIARATPVYPQSISRKELLTTLKTDPQSLGHAICALPAGMAFCEDEGRLSFLSEEGKKKAIKDFKKRSNGYGREEEL